ncbi:hypothetical protein N6H14_24590 [Paenibacillus sp. CC-CFT747]|nr:hypothetical protein N6H14_24590 [Paenibacillus sp. CC-CFT747]
METEMDKPELSAFERFLYWFLVPIVFVLVLIVVLLTLFDYDVKDSLLKAANRVPVVSKLVPDPAAGALSGSGEKPAEQAKAQDKTVADLTAKLGEKDNELEKSDELFLQKDQTIKDLQAKVAQLEEQLKSKAKTDEEYHAQIQQTASLYTKMNPSKAAPIMENLTLKEQVLLFSEMKPDDRVKILEKMDPKKAAEASIYLKDLTPVKDREIAALQERIQLNDTSAKAGQKLTTTDLGQTFSNMTPKSAAAVLVEMYAVNPTKVLDILTATDTQARSKIMSALADANKDTAAKITSKLGS